MACCHLARPCALRWGLLLLIQNRPWGVRKYPPAARPPPGARANATLALELEAPLLDVAAVTKGWPSGGSVVSLNERRMRKTIV